MQEELAPEIKPKPIIIDGIEIQESETEPDFVIYGRDDIETDVKEKLPKYFWWLRPEFKDLVPKEQISFISNGTEVELFNFTEISSEQHKVELAKAIQALNRTKF